MTEQVEQAPPERLFAYYHTPPMSPQVWNAMIDYFNTDMMVIQIANLGGSCVQALIAISQEGLARGRADWESGKFKR
jgi:hypothetical protein